MIIMALAVLAGSRLPLKAQNTSITGILKNASGQPVSGALVKISSDEVGVGFVAVSQEQGRYASPNLLPGKYMVQGFGGDYQSEPAGPVQVRSGQPGKMDLVLSAPLQIPPREKRMTDDDYGKTMPESDEKIRLTIAHTCNECHTLQWVLAARKTPEKWQETIDRMRDKLLGYRKPLALRVPPQEVEGVLYFKYLTKFYGPNAPVDPQIAAEMTRLHPNRNLPSTLLKGAASKFVAMEFSLPAGSAPHDIAVDSQGIAWVSETNTGMLGRYDPNSLSYTRIAVPPGKTPKLQLNAVAVDPQDQVWFVDDGPNARIIQYNPKTRGFSAYPMPEFPWPVPDIGWARTATLRFQNGNVWATGTTSDRILKLNPSTRKFLEYSIPRGSVPLGMVIGEDNMIWYSAEVGNVVVKLDPSTGQLTPIDAPTLKADLRGLGRDSEGNLWVAAMEAGKLVKVDRMGKAVEYTPPSGEPGPFAVDVDAKRNLVWFSEVFSDRIGRFDPSTNTFVEFPQPSADSDVQRIEVDRSHPNRAWWSSTRSNKIGYIEVIE
jgi:virginiamycin B lyase